MSTMIEPTMANGDELLTARELAQWAKLRTSHAIYFAVREGRLKAVRLGDNASIRIRKADALTWLKPVEPKRAEG